MAGLLEQGMRPAQQGQRPPQGQQPPQQPQGQRQGQRPPQERPGDRNAPPEEAKAQFEALNETMLGYLYDKGVDQMENMARQGGDPVKRMGQVIGTIMVTTYNALAQEGKTVAPNVMVRAGMELSRAVGEMAQEMGVLDGNPDEAIEAAFMIGIGRFGKNAKELTQPQKERYAEIIGMIKEAKQRSRGKQGQPPQEQPPQQGMQQGQRPPQQPQQQGGM